MSETPLLPLKHRPVNQQSFKSGQQGQQTFPMANLPRARIGEMMVHLTDAFVIYGTFWRCVYADQVAPPSPASEALLAQSRLLLVAEDRL